MNATHGGFILTRGWHKEPERHSEASKLGWKRRKSGLPPMYYEDLRKAHEQRRLNARLRDERLRAKHTIEKQDVYEDEMAYNVHSWAEQPGRKDVEGIDTPPTKTELGTTEVKTKAEPKMDWYQPALLPDGTYLAQNRDKTKKYTYKISWGISNPYHLKVYYEDHQIYDNKFKTKAEMREALEEQLILMKRMDTREEEKDEDEEFLQTDEGKLDVSSKAIGPARGHEYYMSKVEQQDFKNDFYDQMNVERKIAPNSSIFPLYNALHNYEVAKSLDFEGPTYSKAERLSEIHAAYYDAEGHKKLRGSEARKLIKEYNEVMGDNIGIPPSKVKSRAGDIEKDVYDFIKVNKGVAPREIKYMFGESKAAQEALKTLEKEDKIHYREENMTYYIGSKPRKEKEEKKETIRLANKKISLSKPIVDYVELIRESNKLKGKGAIERQAEITQKLKQMREKDLSSDDLEIVRSIMRIDSIQASKKLSSEFKGIEIDIEMEKIRYQKGEIKHPELMKRLEELDKSSTTEDRKISTPIIEKGKREEKTEKEKFMGKISKDDIDYQLGYNAHRNTSHVPETRAKQEQEDYVIHMSNLYDKLAPYAENEQQKEILQEELEEYRKRYLEKKRALLYRRSGLASTLITGPANFPVRSQRKKHDIHDRKQKEFWDWEEKAETIIKRKINKGKTEEERTDELLNDIERDLNRASIKEIKGEKVPSYVKTNAKARIIGRIDTLVYNGEVEEVETLLNKIEEDQKAFKRPVFTKKHRIWKSVDKAQKYAKKEEKQGSEKILDFSHGEVINNFEDERLQIIFDGKPPTEVRNSLKSSGWRWSPRNNAWQRKNTENAKYSAKYIIKEHYEVEKEKEEKSKIFYDELDLKHERKRISIDEIELKETAPVDIHRRSEKMVEHVEGGGELPPIKVFGKRHEDDTYQVFDGHARVLAYKKLGRETIDAEITLVDEKGQSIKKEEETFRDVEGTIKRKKETIEPPIPKRKTKEEKIEEKERELEEIEAQIRGAIYNKDSWKQQQLAELHTAKEGELIRLKYGLGKKKSALLRR